RNNPKILYMFRPLRLFFLRRLFQKGGFFRMERLFRLRDRKGTADGEKAPSAEDRKDRAVYLPR
ncbi:MAG: hypothetical protein J6S27_04465, partial [Thermoguttaceae bacterium]|nr:hypothetical protein [Thermoguttaceae bacterium]